MNNIVKANLRNPIHFFAVGLGSGMSPIMPGTVGSLVAIPIWLVTLAQLSLISNLIIIVIAAFLGFYLCDKTSKDMGVHDHKSIVWDEFVGMWITLLAIPYLSWQWVVIAFILFRIFDIIKPWPISWCDKNVKGGFGIMVDDLIAGVFAAIVVLVIAHYFPSLALI